MTKRKRGQDFAGAARTVKSRNEEFALTPLVQAEAKDVEMHKLSEGSANGTATMDEGQTRVSLGIKNGESKLKCTTIQVVTGSYERVLHGFAAAFSNESIGEDDATLAVDSDEPRIDFTDTFLFNAHASSITCLALAPLSEETTRVTLATGGTDERINLYSLSTVPPAASNVRPRLPSLHGSSITENPKNKELGSLLHHSSNITALHFPTRSKLLSSAKDSTIAVTRTRDWTALSTFKAPVPKPHGRPSGDTAGPGEVPSGINDFAVHPSMKLMVSIGKGERCMRLWNLVTGRKAGVLNFGRDVLTAVGEGRFGAGEGRRVIWNNQGEDFIVVFERGAVVFSLDSKAKTKITPLPRAKLHQVQYLPSRSHPAIVLVSTEDGRIQVYDTNPSSTEIQLNENIPPSKLIAQLGGPAAGLCGRVKDFEVLSLTETKFAIVAGSSDGTVRFWSLNMAELMFSGSNEDAKGFTAPQVGTLMGSYSTGTRITCLKAFIMRGESEMEEKEEEEEEGEGEEGEEGEEDSVEKCDIFESEEEGE